MKLKSLLACLSIAFTASASATLIDNTSAWNGSNYLSTFGNPNTATYGQVVKATGSQLDSFSFIVNLPDDLQFKAYVYDWNGSQATGSGLFSSAAVVDNGSGFNTVHFSTGGTSVTAGNSYILFLSVSEVFSNYGTGVFASVDASSYTDGDFFWKNNGSDFNSLTSGAWEKWVNGDFAFTANFTDGTSVPEPTPVLLFGLGLLGLVARRRMK